MKGPELVSQRAALQLRGEHPVERGIEAQTRLGECGQQVERDRQVLVDLLQALPPGPARCSTVAGGLVWMQ